MPWLVHPEDGAAEEALLHVHVPRCGGTSLQQAFAVKAKSQAKRGFFGRLGIAYFYYRYRCYEETSFPWKTWENLWALTCFLLSFVMFCSLPGYTRTCLETDSLCTVGVVPYLLTINGLATFLFSTFVGTPPALRLRALRLLNLHACELLQMADARMMTGASRNGFLLHLTASQMLRYGLVTRAQLRGLSFAIVRNPYSRMVSLYLYNRCGEAESFGAFVRRWHAEHLRRRAAHDDDEAHDGAGRTAQQLGGRRAAGLAAKDAQVAVAEELSTAAEGGATAGGRRPLLWPVSSEAHDEWEVYCHVPAEIEFTHEYREDAKGDAAGGGGGGGELGKSHAENRRFGGGKWTQLVAHIIKQEDLYSLRPGRRPAEALLGLPAPLRAALRAMPFANARPRTQPWPAYYTSVEQQMVLEMYSDDFALLGYPREMPSRMDLGLPAAVEEATSAFTPADDDE